MDSSCKQTKFRFADSDNILRTTLNFQERTLDDNIILVTLLLFLLCQAPNRKCPHQLDKAINVLTYLCHSRHMSFHLSIRILPLSGVLKNTHHSY